MTSRSVENEPFVRLLEALRPWLNQVVIVGGWAHRLYRLHPLSQRLEFSPLTTLDTDIAVPKELTVNINEEDLHTRLKAGGFKEEFLGEHLPPVTHYSLAENLGGFYAEFLTPLIGGLENRGRSTATASIGGVTSQKLRYVELLLNAPWNVTVDSSVGYPLQDPIPVQIPNPASYLAQKLLIHERRDSRDRAKHILYIHDTILTFAQSLPQIQDEWSSNVRVMLPARAAAKVANSADALFGEVTDAIRDASIEANATGRNLSPDQLRAVCQIGLRQIFVSG